MSDTAESTTSTSAPTVPGTLPEDILDRIDSGVLLIDNSGRITFANAAVAHLLWRGRHELLDQPLAAFLQPIGNSFLGRTCMTALAGTTTVSTFGRDDVLNRWIAIRLFPRPDGLEIHLRVMAADQHVEPIADDGQQDLLVSLDSLAIPMYIIDAHGIIQHANQAELDLLGYSRDEFIGRHIADFHVDKASAADMLNRLVRGEALQDHESELRRRDGRICTVLITSGAQDTDGASEYIQCFTQDISARREAETRDARLAAIVDSTDDAVIAKRMDGIITSWNRGAERLYGYSAEEALWHPVTMIIPRHREDEFPDFMSRLARGEHIDHYETVRQHKSGRLIDVSVSIAPIRNQSGRIVGASTIARDITERRILERKQNEFLMMVAHELRSPLTGIKGYTQLMQRRQAYSERSVNAMHVQISQMERLVGDVLDITRIDEDRLVMHFVEVDLISVVQTAIARARSLGETDRIRLIAPPGPMVGVWDEGRLDQVLDNVLSNATKYAPNGDITVTLTRRSNTAEVTIQDQGPGILPQNLPFIFDRFFREHNWQSPHRGVGLGLAITRALVEEHGGEITVSSDPGVGTVFTIALPWTAPNSDVQS